MSVRYRLVLPQSLHDEMISQALRELPNECCGMLAGSLEEAGRVGLALGVYTLINEAASPREYLSEPMSMFRAMKAIRADHREVLAIYHSHPTSDPIPSRKDRADNYSPDVMNLIISLKGDEPSVRAWWLTDNEYAEAEWGME